MLIKGETFNERKKSLLNEIMVIRGTIKNYNDQLKKTGNAIYFALIDGERIVLKQRMEELMQLKKWQKERYEKAGLSKKRST